MEYQPLQTVMSIYRKNPQTAGRIVDGLAFVVTPDDNKLHTLNSTGTELWRLAQEADGLSVERAAKEFVAKFQVEQQVAVADVEQCLDAFAKAGIFVKE
ncbi:MAG: PqqD family protein [Myxococcales bacterium]|nr:PqqD family protein [Myxococcales bacterium]